jgi:(1->4)-alpha-D-glucan 1-alpha-D-glucosylmutase
MATQPRIPTATYRLVQLNRNFTFKQAEGINPYLRKLGISDVYTSPFYRSRPDSAHGYDMTNHNELNPAIGTLEDLASFTAKLKEHGMGHSV